MRESQNHGDRKANDEEIRELIDQLVIKTNKSPEEIEKELEEAQQERIGKEQHSNEDVERVKSALEIAGVPGIASVMNLMMIIDSRGQHPLVIHVGKISWRVLCLTVLWNHLWYVVLRMRCSTHIPTRYS